MALPQCAAHCTKVVQTVTNYSKPVHLSGPTETSDQEVRIKDFVHFSPQYVYLQEHAYSLIFKKALMGMRRQNIQTVLISYTQNCPALNRYNLLLL